MVLDSEPSGNISATVAKQIAAAVSHVNVAPEIIVITEDKTRLCLIEWRDRIEDSQGWIAPLSLVLSLAFTFLTSTFHDVLGLPRDTWQAFALFCIVLAIGWLVVGLVRLIRLVRSQNGSIDSLIGKMKKGGQTSIGGGVQHKIRITYPRSGETLSGAQQLGAGFSYPVRGYLEQLPQGHEIWLLTAAQRSDQFWPQGFFPVQLDSATGEWYGRINASRGSPFRIFAVVAPPTSQDLFRYFQRRGDETGTFVPLDRIPLECANADLTEAFVP
jgi:hypothetical protein